MRQKTIVFDFGGVIFNTSVREFYRERFEKQGKSEKELNFFLDNILTKRELSYTNGGDLSDLIADKILKHPEWADEIRAYGHDAEFLKSIQSVVNEMDDVLEELTQKGYCIVGLTNWHGDTYDVLFKSYPSLMKHFNEVVVSGKVKLRKPDPEIFRYAHKKYGAPVSADVYYFDDKAANVESAKNTVGWNGYVFKDADTVRKALALKKHKR